MESCTFTDFIDTLKPWLSTDYIHRARLSENGRFLLLFSDGGQREFEVEGCTRTQLADVMELLRQNGIRVEP